MGQKVVQVQISYIKLQTSLHYYKRFEHFGEIRFIFILNGCIAMVI